MAQERVETKFVMSAEDRASAVFKAMNSEMSRVQSTISGVQVAFTALAAAAPIAALTAKVTQSAQLADSLGKLSQKTGIATEGLSALRYQAELSDVPFEDLQGALRKFSVNLAGAAGGSKEQVAAFKALGLSQQDIQAGLGDTETLLKKVADRFAGYADGASKTALAVEIFGKSGDRMIPMLNEGAAGLEKARIQLERFGGVISGDFAKQSQELNDNMTRLKFLSEAAAISVGSKLVPALADATGELIKGREIFGSYFKAIINLGAIDPFKTVRQNIAELNKDIERYEQGKARALGQGRSGAAAAFDPAIENARKRIQFLQFQQSLADDKAKRLADPTGGRGSRGLVPKTDPSLAPVVDKSAGGANEGQSFLESLQKRLKAVEENEFAALRLEAAQKKVSAAADPLINQLEKETRFRAELKAAQDADEQAKQAEISRRQALVNGVGDYVQSLEDETRLMKLSNTERAVEIQLLKLEAAGWNRTSEEFQTAQRNIANAVRGNEAAKIFEETRTPLEKYNAELDRVRALYLSGALGPEEWARKVALLTDEYQKANSVATEAESIGKSLGLTFSSAFEDAISGGKRFSDVLKGIASDVVKLGFRKSVTEPAGSALSKLFNGIFSSKGPESSVNWENSFDLGQMAAFANGGSFMVGGYGGTDSQRVSFLASPSERVTIETPEQQRRNRGGDINITVNAPGADMSVVQRIDAAVRQAVSLSLQAVQAQSDRGGSFARAVGRR